MSNFQEPDPKNRAAVYIDGFNLYHPINEMDEPFLKWCNLWKLSELLCKPKVLDLRKVVFCTAMPLHRHGSLGRHQTFNNAQKAMGVTVEEGHYIFNEEIGRHTEKQSDINLAISLILDAIDDVFDWAFLLSADSDQAATARFLKSRCPEKRLVVVAPPNRAPPNKALEYAEQAFSLPKAALEECLLPQYVKALGEGFIRRPPEYDPPDWWLPPDQRPKRKR